MKSQHGPAALRRSLLVLLALSSAACATGEVTGSEDDAGFVPDDDRPTTAEDVGFSIDLVNPLEEDIGSGAADAGTKSTDTGSVGVDAGSVDVGSVDSGSIGVDAGSVEVGTPDVGTPDVGTADSGAPDVGTPDVGGCSTGETMCGGGCVDLQRDARNCGSCGRACGEVEACTDGACASTCAAPRMLCGTGASTRCVDTRSDVENCGSCGMACGAGRACTAGSCAAAACMTSASDCNGNSADGCEVVHNAAVNTCAAPMSLGAYCGDTGCGFLCTGRDLRVVSTRTGTRSQWFRVRINECSSCPAALNARVRLRVPAGVDYDLFTYSACGRLVGSSQALAGVTDEITITGGGSFGSDSADVIIEVRWFSGASCMPWTLTVEARSNSATSC